MTKRVSLLCLHTKHTDLYWIWILDLFRSCGEQPDFGICLSHSSLFLAAYLKALPDRILLVRAPNSWSLHLFFWIGLAWPSLSIRISRLRSAKSTPSTPLDADSGGRNQQIPEGGQNLMPPKAHDVLRLVKEAAWLSLPRLLWFQTPDFFHKMAYFLLKSCSLHNLEETNDIS